MSWLQKLVDTYENCETSIGYEENSIPLLPIFHTTQKAQIEIIIDGEGNFLRAKVIPKQDARTIIPCTEQSGGRTSGEAPHPLCDKLQYIASDYKDFGGSKTPYFKSFFENLEKWSTSEFSNPKIDAVYKYVKQGSVIQDLINQNVLIVNSEGKLAQAIDKNDSQPEIFSVLPNQEDAFIRWIVEIPESLETRVWKDNSIWNAWINYYSTFEAEKDLCYLTGEVSRITKNNPAKLRNDGDKAKIISGNDTSGFTFRGRFTNDTQAASLGVIPSQKAHFALRWLINKQGYQKGDQAIVAWATNGKDIPNPTSDLFSVLDFENILEETKKSTYTAQDLAILLRKRIAGYGKEIKNTTDVVVLGLDSATTGRASITFYRLLTGSDFLERINDWHESCAWLHSYRSVEFLDSDTGKKIKKIIPFIGAPAPYDIAEAVYGSRIDDKLRKATVNRILPCIIDGQQIPRDLVETAVRRASNRLGSEYWEWNKTLTITCALFRKYFRKERYTMALELNRKSRDYLYGRLLALAESLEEWALQEFNEKRETNAARLMQRFSERPFSTWQTIELSLLPYKSKLGGKSKKRQRMIDEVVAMFDTDDFLNDKKLSGEFLLGYHCQREYLRNQNSQASFEQKEEEKISELITGDNDGIDSE